MIYSRLRHFRLAKGFTLDQLADSSKVSRGTINRIELKRVSPRMDTLVDLCNALGITVGDLFRPEPTEVPPAPPKGADEPGGLRKGTLTWLEHAEALIRYSADSLTVLDRDGFVMYESDSALQFHGLKPEARRALPWWTCAHPEDQAQLREGFQRVVDRSETSCLHQYRAAHRDGTWHWVRTTLSRQLEQPLIEGIIASTQDVTLLKQLEDGVGQSQKLDSLAVALGGVTHIFSNFLMGIQANLELAQGKLTAEAPVAKHLEAMQVAVHGAATLLDKMRDFAGNPLISVESLNLNELIRSLVPPRKALSPGSQHMHLELDETLPDLDLDHHLVARLLKDLLSNAGDALGDNPGTLTIRTAQGPLPEDGHGAWIEKGLEGHTSGVLLEIRDTGCGIEPAQLTKLFDPFYSTKFTGRGMGLPSVLGTVRAHRGALRVQSEPGRGSCFQVFFPLRPNQIKTAEIKTTVAAGGELPQPSRTAILVVEDDLLLRGCMQEMLKRLGDRKVFEAANGEEALSIFQRHQGEIGLVLMDIDMPLMDGIEAFSRLRQLDPDLSIVFTTGAWEPNFSLVTHVTDSHTGILHKPYNLKQLGEVLATYR